jgi:cell division septation protein DedD
MTAKEMTPDQPASKRITKESNKKPEAKDSSSVSEDSGKADGPTYTVQLAAFRSSSEARSFSKKQANNSLKTYITTSIAKNKTKVYKVKSGEFKDRKSAEVLSLKLNKTEKLKTFVTLKSE